MKPIIMQFSPSSGYFLPLNPNFLLISLRVCSVMWKMTRTKIGTIIGLYITFVMFLNNEPEGILNSAVENPARI
jgi:hypothetical protein